MVRSVESRALHVLRQIDEAASRNEGGEVTVQVPEDVAIYLLNNKRQQLGDIEASCALTINVEIDRELTSMEMTLIAPNQGKMAPQPVWKATRPPPWKMIRQWSQTPSRQTRRSPEW